MMLQLNLTNLFIVAAFWVLACRPSSPYAHVAAAASGWAATYTLTNGLVAMIALALVAHLTGSRLRVFGRRDVFWTTNLIVVAATYFPGLPPQPGGRPGPIDLARFTFIYLGAPVGDLIHYPFHGIFDVPTMTWLNGIVGFALAVLAVFVCLSARHRLRAGDPAAAILVGFTLFAFGSAVLTAWGRAKFDAFGVADANSSRYTVYSSFLVYGLIVFGAATVARPGWRLTGHARSRYTKRATFAAVCILVVAALGFSAVAYGRGVRVYRDAHHWNAELAQAYSLDSGARKLDRIIYPNPEVSEEIKSDLMRLHLGPYRFVRETAVEAAAVTGDSVYRGAVALKPGAPLSVRFRATDDGLDALGVTVVTWGQHSSGSLTWSLDRIAHQVSRHVTGGVLDLTNVNDWQTVRLPVGYVSSSRNSTFVLTVGASAPFSPSLGVPIYSESRGTPAASLTIAGRVYPRRALRVVAFYAHD
jgi:hypothetical protein